MKSQHALLAAVALALLAVGLGGCASKGEAPAPAASTQPIAETPVNKYCPVDTKNPIDPKVTYLYDGKLYGFCCADCIKEFKKDPSKYAAAAK